MPDYSVIKQALTRQSESTKYFTKSFYDTFRNAIAMIKFNREHGIDDYYYDGNILTMHAYDDVRKTQFYRKNSTAYCVFLEIIHGGLR